MSDQPDTPGITVTIEKLVSGGHGLARTPRVQLVPLAVPGDQGRIADTGPMIRPWHRLDSPSPARTAPNCAQFGDCGGCQWQMLPLPLQRYWKQAILAENLSRLGKLPPPYPLHPVSDGGGYHSRHQIRCRVTLTDQQRLQLTLLGWDHQPVAPDPCWLVPPAIQAAMAQVAQTPWPLDIAPDTLTIRQGDELHMLLSFATWQTDWQTPLTRWSESLTGTDGVHLTQNGVDYYTLAGNPHLVHTLGAWRFRVSPTSFFQVNPTAAIQLARLTAELAGQGDRLLDAYSGVGLFSVALASQFQHITAVEAHAAAHRDAIINTAGLSVTQHQQTMETFCQNTIDAWPVAVVDPPRAGLSPVVLRWFAKHITHRVVLIGCDAAAVSRDIGRFVQAGWQLTAVHPVDMFPHTHHVETVALLTRLTYSRSKN